VNQSYSLSKSEIIRGHNSFNDIFKSASKISSGRIKLFFNQSKSKLNSPHGILKVGFVISAKRISSSVQRNKIKRLLKEAYRNVKNNNTADIDAEVLIGLSDYGYEILQIDKKLELNELKNDISDAFSVLFFKLRNK